MYLYVRLYVCARLCTPVFIYMHMFVYVFVCVRVTIKFRTAEEPNMLLLYQLGSTVNQRACNKDAVGVSSLAECHKSFVIP
jgi:hypothetical protein